MEDDLSSDDTIFNGQKILTYTSSTDSWSMDTKSITNGSLVWFETEISGDDNTMKLIWFFKWEDDNSK